MIAKNLARWRAEAKRKGKTPNLEYLRARDRQEHRDRVLCRAREYVRRYPPITFNPEWLLAFPGFTEALRPAAKALVLACEQISGSFDGFYVPPRSND